MLQMRDDRGQVFQRLDCFASALAVARPQRRGQDLLEQRGLSVCRCTEDAQIARCHAVPGELVDRADYLPIEVVVATTSALKFTLDDAVLLELLHEPLPGA